jgi:small subunit ribosomal protein S8
MMTDPIADLLTRIRNASRIKRPIVQIPHSIIKEGICGVLQRAGYITGFSVLDTVPGRTIRVDLKYTDDDEVVIRRIQRESKPGCRRHLMVDDIPKVLNGLGIGVYTTSKGILTDHECRQQRVGGEYLCSVW